jgi:hypothetical protein
MTKIPFLTGTVSLTSSLSLEQLAHKISKELSIDLKQDTNGLYEEVPTYYGDTLGLRLAVMDIGDGYVVSLVPNIKPSLAGIDTEDINVTLLLAHLLSNITAM